MKQLITIFALFMIVFGVDVKASVAFEVEGTLIVNELKDLPLDMRIETLEGQIKLSNVHTSYVRGCTYGTYLVVENLADDDYTLLEMIECLDDTQGGELKDDVLICPEIWMPVCGSFENELQTFGNLCELKASKGLFKSMGACL